MRRCARVSACALVLACALVVLLALTSPRIRAQGTAALHLSTGHDPLVLCAYTESRVLDERYVRWSRTAALWGARGEALGARRAWRWHGMKVNLLRERMRELVEAGGGDTVVLYTDSYDVMFVGPVSEAASRFVAGGEARVLFAGGVWCWPDDHLRPRYPLRDGPYPYLNAGAIIGYASALLELTSLAALPDAADDQRYYTAAYLNASVRERLRLRVDQRAQIFQCLADVTGDVRVVSAGGGWARVENAATGTRPLVLHANGPQKKAMWRYEAELVRAWVTRPHLAPAGARAQELGELAELYGLTHDDDQPPDY